MIYTEVNKRDVFKITYDQQSGGVRMNNQKTFLTVEDLAEELGITESATRRACREGFLSDISKKVGRRYFIHREALNKKFLKEVE